MKALQKWILVLALLGVGGGLFVTVTRADLSPAWTVVLPFGVILIALFLVMRFLQNEAARFDEDEHRRLPESRSSQNALPDGAGKSRQRTNEAPTARGLPSRLGRIGMASDGTIEVRDAEGRAAADNHEVLLISQ